jgi:hypothetical protein
MEENNNKRLKVSMTEEVKVGGEQMKAEIEIGKDYNYH